MIDVYSFLLKNLNPLITERKSDNENDRKDALLRCFGKNALLMSFVAIFI